MRLASLVFLGTRCGMPNLRAPITFVRLRPAAYHGSVFALRTNVHILNSMATLGCPFGDSQRTLCNCFKL